MADRAQERSSIQRILPDTAALVVLLALVIAFFWKHIFTNLILPRGDAFTYFYPYWAYRNEALQAGQLPLWNPYLFMGAPFLANSQAGVLYPLNWPLSGFDAPAAIKIAMVAHVTLAATGMYLFSRRTLRFSVLSATLSAAAFGLGGYFTAQAEHINQLQGLAWLPWLFWLWNAALAGRPRAVLGVGIIFALQVLAGHTQTVFISGVGLGAWALWKSVQRGLQYRTRSASSQQSNDQVTSGDTEINHQQHHHNKVRGTGSALVHIIWPVLIVAIGAAVAVGLSAAQILPTLELASLSNRGGGLPVREALTFSLRPHLIGRALLPDYREVSLFSEYVAFVGIAGLFLALIGAWQQRRRWVVQALVLQSVVGLVFALGAYNPLYWALVRFVPGFDLFRAPARWLALYAFGTAGLIGAGLDAISAQISGGANVTVGERSHVTWRTLWPAAPILLLAALAFAAPLAQDVPGAQSPALGEVLAWAGVLIIASGVLIWLPDASQKTRRAGLTMLAGLVVAELFIASRSLGYNNLSSPTAWSHQRPSISTLLAAGDDSTPPARFLSLSDTLFDPGDLHELEAVYGTFLTDDALYDLIVATKQQEILAPNLSLAWRIPAIDGFDGGILPLHEYTRFTALFQDEDEIAPDGRLRENLDQVPDAAWLRMSNVRWIITDKVFDAWIDNIYYDLQFPQRGDASPAPPIHATPRTTFQATSLGVVGYLEEAEDVAPGTAFAQMAVYIVGGDSPRTITLVTGDHFSPGSANERLNAVISWGEAAYIDHIEFTVLEDFPGVMVLQGATLIDERTHAFITTTLSRDGRLRLAHSGDVKIYEDQGTQPRAYLTCIAEAAENPDQPYQRLAEDPYSFTIEADPAAQTVASCDPLNPGDVTITNYAAEQVTIEVENRSDAAYLILADAWYPGWQATANGISTRIFRVNGMFRAVRLPRGNHEVVFTYRSQPLEQGLIISGVFIVVVTLGMIIEWENIRFG